MVECPVCGKWLKNIFALNGHIRLKGDNLHHAYFESHKKQIQNKDTTNIENKRQKLILLVKEKGDLLETQYNDLLFILNKVVERLIKSNPNLTKASCTKRSEERNT